MDVTSGHAAADRQVLVLTANPVVAGDIAEVIGSACAGCAVRICASIEQGMQMLADLGRVAGAVVAGTLPLTEREQLYAAMLNEGSWLIEIDGESRPALPEGVACTVLPRPFNTEMLVSALRSVTAGAPGMRNG